MLRESSPLRVGFFFLLNMLCDEMVGLFCDVGIASAADEPLHLGFAAKPGELAFGVVAVALLGLSDSLFAGDFIVQDGGCFGVAERREGAAGFAITGYEALGLFDETAVEHGGGALVDALVEKRARWIEAEAKNSIAGERVPALLPLLGHGSAGSSCVTCGE